MRRRGRRWRRSASAKRCRVVGIAKGRDRDAGRETFFKPGQPPFKLPPRDPALYFVQRLRDEAHRFAIGAHRAKRKRELVKNPLDEIAGIGPTRKRALLHHFGTVKAIQRAGPGGSDEGAGRECRDGAGGLRFLPRTGLRFRPEPTMNKLQMAGAAVRGGTRYSYPYLSG